MTRTPLPADPLQRRLLKVARHLSDPPAPGTEWVAEQQPIMIPATVEGEPPDTTYVNLKVRLEAPLEVEGESLVVSEVTLWVDDIESPLGNTLPWRVVNPPLLVQSAGGGDVPHQTHRRPHDLKYEEDTSSAIGEIILDMARSLIE